MLPAYIPTYYILYTYNEVWMCVRVNIFSRRMFCDSTIFESFFKLIDLRQTGKGKFRRKMCRFPSRTHRHASICRLQMTCDEAEKRETENDGKRNSFWRIRFQRFHHFEWNKM